MKVCISPCLCLLFNDCPLTPFLDEDPEELKEQQARLVEKFQPLTEWLKNQTEGVVIDGACLFRLVSNIAFPLVFTN
jgi:hypothetical protein